MEEKELGFYSREEGDVIESALHGDQVGSQVGGGYVGSRDQVGDCCNSTGGS